MAVLKAAGLKSGPAAEAMAGQVCKVLSISSMEELIGNMGGGGGGGGGGGDGGGGGGGDDAAEEEKKESSSEEEVDMGGFGGESPPLTET